MTIARKPLLLKRLLPGTCLKMESQETPNDKETSDLKIQSERWNCFSCKNPFRITFLRVFPLLTFAAGVVILALGFGNGHLKSELLRMAGVILISFSVFWFFLGNFVDFCMNTYGKDVRDTEQGEGNTTSATLTEVMIEDSLVRGSWI